MRSNPPIEGHELLFEGRPQAVWDATGDWYQRDVNGDIIHNGGCRCGAKPDGWPNVSASAVKRWHRLHKDELRWRS